MKEEKEISAIDLLISTYLSGNATLDQCAELMSWLESSEDNRVYFAQQKALWIYAVKETTANGNEKWYQLKYKLKEKQSEKYTFDVSKEKVIRRIVYAAASVILFIGSSVTCYLILKPKNMPAMAENELYVPYGSRSRLTLPDGTKLWANAGSKVTYNIGFGKNNRDISLTGEAFFDVAKNRKLPFVVHTANLKIKAIGTAFNVKAYPEEKRVETTLVRGLVEIEKPGRKDKILLKPNQKVVFTDHPSDNDARKDQVNTIYPKNEIQIKEDTKQEVKLEEKVDTEKETGWKDGKLIFDREPLISLVSRLERRFDVHFNFTSEKLKDYRYTGTFNDVSLEQIMDAMQLSSPVNYIIQEKEVRIMEKNN